MSWCRPGDESSCSSGASESSAAEVDDAGCAGATQERTAVAETVFSEEDEGLLEGRPPPEEEEEGGNGNGGDATEDPSDETETGIVPDVTRRTRSRTLDTPLLRPHLGRGTRGNGRRLCLLE